MSPSELVDADLVAGSLYQGSAPKRTRGLHKTVDAICFAAWEYQPPRWWQSVRVLRALLDDSGLPMTKKEKYQAIRVSRDVRKLLDFNKVVLVTCHSGFNRSGLICAMALMLPACRKSNTPSNLSSSEAIGLVKRARGPRALSNEYFVQFIESMNMYRPLCNPVW